MPKAVRGGVAAVPPRHSRPDLRHGRHPHPARWRGPTSPLQGEVIRDAHLYANKASAQTEERVASGRNLTHSRQVALVKQS
jgi:hypothetical protein